VTTVKTGQTAGRAQSSAAQITEDYVEFPSSLPHTSSSPPTREQLAALTSVPAALHASKNGNSRGRGKSKGSELNKALGNDTSIPWKRSLKDRSQIVIVGGAGPITALVSAAVPAFGAQYFYVGQLDNMTSLALVFDEYHVIEIEVLITSQVTEVVTTAADVGTYVTAVDIDDSSTPVSYAQVNSYPSSIASPATMSHYHRWAPRYSVATYSGAFSSYSTSNGWVDCASPNVQYYGIKLAAPGVVVAQSFYMDIRMKVAFRGLH